MNVQLSFFVFIITFLTSCKSNTQGNAFLPIGIHLVDSSGKDLFSFENDGNNGYWMDSVKAYDIGKGRRDFIQCSDFSDTTGRYFYNIPPVILYVCLNQDFQNRTSLTLLNIKRGVWDTLKISINQDKLTSSTLWDTIWYNNKPVYWKDGAVQVTK